MNELAPFIPLAFLAFFVLVILALGSSGRPKAEHKPDRKASGKIIKVVGPDGKLHEAMLLEDKKVETKQKPNFWKVNR